MTRLPQMDQGRSVRGGYTEAFVFPIAMAVVFLAPLPLGSNRPWAWTLEAVIIGALTAILATSRVVSGEPFAVPLRRVAVPAALFLIVIAWIVVQTIPIPGLGHPIWMLVGDAGGRISINPAETWSALVRLCTCLCVFWLFLQTGRSTMRARQFAFWFMLTGLAYAIYGLVVFFAGNETILFFEKWAYQDSLTSTFVNRNSYATYAGLTLLCAITVVVHEFLGGSWIQRNRVHWSIAFEVLRTGFWIALTAVAAIASTLLLTGSRGGLIGVIFGLVVLFVAFTLSRALSLRVLAALAVVATLPLLGLFVVSGDSVTARMDVDRLAQEMRPDIYAVTRSMIIDAPLTGSGYGTYPDLFTMYRDERHPVALTEAHSTYLELFSGLGILKAAAAIAAVALVVIACAVSIRRRKRRGINLHPALGIAVSAQVGVHSLLDFSLQIPAVALTYTAILALSLSQCCRTKAGNSEPTA